MRAAPGMMGDPIMSLGMPSPFRSVRPRRMLASLAAALLLVTASCDKAPVLPVNSGVRVIATRDVVAINNANPDAPLYTLVVDPRWLMLVDWMPCVEEQCGMIAPGSTRRVTAESLGLREGDEVVIYHWRAIAPADLPVPGPVTMLRVRLTSFPHE